MIENEDIVYKKVSGALRNAFGGIFITGVEITDTPPQFPAVYIVKKNSSVNGRYFRGRQTLFFSFYSPFPE